MWWKSFHKGFAQQKQNYKSRGKLRIKFIFVRSVLFQCSFVCFGVVGIRESVIVCGKLGIFFNPPSQMLLQFHMMNLNRQNFQNKCTLNAYFKGKIFFCLLW